MSCPVDLVIIGAGWSGLAAAKTYLELHPDGQVAVIESGSTVGGTWQSSRIYPHLRANNVLGEYEYPDFPMDELRYGVRAHDHIPGEVIHRYLTDYAKAFGIFPHIHFNTHVLGVAETTDHGWLLEMRRDGGNVTLQTRKLIIATGLTSRPNIPEIQGIETFQGAVFHSRDFGKLSSQLTGTKRAFVLGGAKSALDMAYALASSGVDVDLMIRRSGHGPVWLAPAFLTPWKLSLGRLLHTRLFTWLSPCIWGNEDGFANIRRFLHETWLGSKLCDAFWASFGAGRFANDEYRGHAMTEMLRPWGELGLMGTASSINNYPTNFFDLVQSGKIKVHIDEISRVERNTMYLDSGDNVTADAFIYATGWKKEPSFTFSDKVALKLGLQPTAELQSLAELAEAELVTRFPQLERIANDRRIKQLMEDDSRQGDTPTMRLYRFMVPPANIGAKNLAFVGMASSISPAICASLQALWICAYFDGQLERLPTSQEDIKWSTALHTSFSKLEHPSGYGAAFPDLVLTNLPYYDMLLRDLGLRAHRKNSMWKEAVEGYGPRDYDNVVREWCMIRSPYSKWRSRYPV